MCIFIKFTNIFTMFWKNLASRLFWGIGFLVILLLAQPINWDIKIHDHIIESDNIFDIKKIFNKTNRNNIPKSNIWTWILDQIKNDSEMHWAAEDRNAKFIKSCSDRQSLCDKVIYTNISDKNKFFYQSILNLVMNRLDSFSKLSVSDTIKIINIDWWSSDRRWYAGRTKLYIHPKDILSYREFMDVFTHEMWHIIDLWVIQWSEWLKLDDIYTEFGQPSFAIDDKSLDFYKISRSNENTTYKETSYKDFVSGYGMSNPFEDFAECQNMYINHQNTFAKMAEDSLQLKSKLEFFQNIYNTKYIQNDDKNTKKIAKNNTRRPRDTTRLR